MNNTLTAKDIKEVQNFAREKLGLCRKENDIIGTQIFSILSIYARVIYYPLGKDAIWGFTRISGSRNDAILEKPFVAINSSIPVDCQVFAAAHELYHIWYEQAPDVLPSDLLDEQDKKLNEKKANRFAAEFLVDEQLLNQELASYEIKKFTIKDILRMSSLFTVPYKAMAKRLSETGRISQGDLSKFLSETDESIERYRKLYSTPVPKPDNRIAIDNLIELAVAAFEKDLITYEKLEYLLRLGHLKPEELGIMPEAAYSFPSDDELAAILEE